MSSCLVRLCGCRVGKLDGWSHAKATKNKHTSEKHYLCVEVHFRHKIETRN